MTNPESAESSPNREAILAHIGELLMEHMSDGDEWQPWCRVQSVLLLDASGRILGEEEQIEAKALLLTMGNGSRLRLTVTPERN